MKFILDSLAGFMLLMFISRIILWIAVDIPLDSKAMLVILLLTFFFIYRNKWTFAFAYVIFIAATLHPIIYHHISGLSFFVFSSSIYHYYKTVDGDLPTYILLFTKYFYPVMIMLFLVPSVWRAYGLRKRKKIQ